MYFNNVHILIYVAIAVAGFFIGKFVNWCNYRLPEYKKVFCKEMFKAKELEEYKTNLLLSLITMLIYIILLYFLGIQKTFLGNLNLIKYLILTPMLLSAFIIDYKLQIIPNRLNMTMFEIGIFLMFLAGIFNPNIAIDMFLGHSVGLEIHEIPTLGSKSEAILKPNMIITDEPGIYIAGHFGIRIEDTVIVGKSIGVPLTKSSKEIIII